MRQSEILDDPFGTPLHPSTSARKQQKQRSNHSTPSSQRFRTEVSWRSGSEGSPSKTKTNVLADGKPVSNRNAQAIYPPSACVFVAKSVFLSHHV